MNNNFLYNYNSTILQQTNTQQTNTLSTNVFLLSALLSTLALFIIFIIELIGYIFIYLTYKEIARLTNVKAFNTAGFALLIGAASIIIGIGSIIILIGLAYGGVGWHRLRNKDYTPKDSIPKSIKTTT